MPIIVWNFCHKTYLTHHVCKEEKGEVKKKIFWNQCFEFGFFFLVETTEMINKKLF